jgi:threonine dehydratase
MTKELGSPVTSMPMIEGAARRLSGIATETPLLSSPFLDQIAGRRVLIKAECLQLTGSFKFRGAYSAISALEDDERRRGVIAFSSGNHAQGVALAARMFQISSTIVMPSDAPRAKIDNTRSLGAEVVLYDRHREDRDAIGFALSEERRQTLVRPYDDPQVIAGQGSVGLEIARQAKAFGINEAEVLVPCGGGGLASGIALALEQAAPGMQVRTCEPEGFDDAARSLAAGEITPNEGGGTTICDAIVTVQPGILTFPIMRRLCGEGLAVSDDEVREAMALAFSRLKIVLEPSGAVSLAAALFSKEKFKQGPLIVVASGGNSDAKILA